MIASNGPLTILVNRAAGGAGGAAEAISAAMAREGLSADVREIDPGALADAVAGEVAAGARALGVAGGDGTLSTAAGPLAGGKVVLVPFPMGTLNHFARRLGLDDVDAAARALREGRTVRVPLGWVNGRRFVNNVSCGFYPRVVRQRERLRPWIGKWPAAAIAALQVFAGLRRMHLTLETPAATMPRRVAGLWIGLGRGSFRLPGADRLEERASELEIVLPPASTRWQLLALAARVVWRLARHERRPTAGLEILHAPALVLESRRPVDVALDGETFHLAPPVRFRLEPEALEVVVGPAAGRA
jgi:undecaprenyl-diphosphatase